MHSTFGFLLSLPSYPFPSSSQRSTACSSPHTRSRSSAGPSTSLPGTRGRSATSSLRHGGQGVRGQGPGLPAARRRTALSCSGGRLSGLRLAPSLSGGERDHSHPPRGARFSPCVAAPSRPSRVALALALAQRPPPTPRPALSRVVLWLVLLDGDMTRTHHLMMLGPRDGVMG